MESMEYSAVHINGYEEKGSAIKRQLRALFLKNLSLQLQYKKTNLFLFIMPALIVLIVGIMALMFKLSAESSSDDNYIYTDTVDANNPYGSWIWGYFVNAPTADGIPAGNLSSQGYKQGYLGLIDQVPLVTYSDYFPASYNSTPFFVEAPSANWVDDTIQQALDDLSSHYNDGNPSFKYTGSIPIAVLEFNKLNPANMEVDYIVQRDSKGYTEYYWYMPYYLVEPSSSEAMAIFTYYADTALINYFLNATMNTTVNFDFTISSWDGSGYSMDNVNVIFALFMLPFAFCLGIPFISFMLVSEKSTKFLEMMKIVCCLLFMVTFQMGLRMRAYWLINMTYFSTVWFVSFLILYAISLAFQTPWVISTSPFVVILLFLLWSISATCFAMFWAQLLPRPLLAAGSLAAVVVVLPQVSALLAAAVWSDAEVPPMWFVLFPPNSIVWGIWLMNQRFSGSQGYVLDLSHWTSAFTTQMGLLYVAMIVQSVVCLLLNHYLYNIIPREFGQTYSWYYPITDLFNQKEHKPIISISTPAGPEEDEQHDVSAERIRASDMNKNFQVRMHGLGKVYDHSYKTLVESKQVALKNFYLALEGGECFGLLGPNGAGKSTLVNILTGLTRPTSGFAVIHGFDINTHMEQVHQLIGFCPQFDVLWDELTVEDHLLFYMRLKGTVPRAMEKTELKNIVTRLQLTFSKQKIGTLSGGQKRRVSIAIAFVGDSKLILLDEPTTGLDLTSRHEIWNLINEQKVGRSILLTTHNMQEADALCTRIGIMSQGKLLCIDQPNYLKSRFGKGFKLSVTPTRGNAENVKQKLMDKYPSIQHESTFACSERFLLESNHNEEYKSLVITDVMQDLIAIKNQGLVADWIISQCSLEEVFLNLIQEDEIVE